MVKIELEEWQVKNLRKYFGENDKTQTEHWAFSIFDKAYKEQCNIPVVTRRFIHKLTGTQGTFIKEYKPTGRPLTMQIMTEKGIYFAPKNEFELLNGG